tara:strand:- start:536 stop:799 length:264 start_codon:yes stop_codon:yes gene_type:complete
MKKKDYKITPTEFSFGTSFKVEVWDDYGNYVEVYERTITESWKFIYDYWSKSEENEKKKQLMNRAIQSCIKLDEESGRLRNNRDNLD